MFYFTYFKKVNNKLAKMWGEMKYEQKHMNLTISNK